MSNTKTRWIHSVAALALVATVFVPSSLNVSRAQGNARTFPETNHTISGRFLEYWDTHGGLAQQGYPISELVQEVSSTDGKTYTVQYFERAVFESHPENSAPNDVLLSLLGVFRLHQKYPNGEPAPVSTSGRLYPQTGKHVDEPFRTYWDTHGGLAQQGYPISERFKEVSDLDGKTYDVQYFERAVFEYHPENPPANSVLLSQLGTFKMQQKQVPATATPAPPTPTARPTSTPMPPTPTAVPRCDLDVPDPKDATVTPKCGPVGTVFQITAHGFTPSEALSFWITMPDGEVLGTPAPLNIGAHNGSIRDTFDSSLLDLLGMASTGIWAITYEGEQSEHQSIVWFKIVPKGNPTPTPTGTAPQTCDTSGDVDGESTPSGGRPGTTLQFRARGFSPGEAVSFWFTLPDGGVFGTTEPVPSGFVNSDGTIGPLPFPITEADVQIATGRWAVTFEGASTHHQSIIYFCLYP